MVVGKNYSLINIQTFSNLAEVQHFGHPIKKRLRIQSQRRRRQKQALLQTQLRTKLVDQSLLISFWTDKSFFLYQVILFLLREE